MTWVLLQSKAPWQRNDAITFFIYLCVSLYYEFFWRNRLKEYVHLTQGPFSCKFYYLACCACAFET